MSRIIRWHASQIIICLCLIACTLFWKMLVSLTSLLFFGDVVLLYCLNKFNTRRILHPLPSEIFIIDTFKYLKPFIYISSFFLYHCLPISNNSFLPALLLSIVLFQNIGVLLLCHFHFLFLQFSLIYFIIKISIKRYSNLDMIL